MSNDFRGLNAIVTGAGSGIGLAVAKKLQLEGATIFGFDITVGEMNGVATWVECDVGNSDSVVRAVAKVAEQVGVIDILANNAGVGAVEKYSYAAPAFIANSGATVMDRCSGGSNDGAYVAAASTQAAACTVGGGSLVNTGIKTP